MRKRDLGILIICAFAILWSFRGEQGGYYFTESWVIPIDTTLYSNLHFPTKGEKLPKPLITDLDGDEQNEIIYTSRDCTIKIAEVLPTMGLKSTPTNKAQTTLLRRTGVRSGRRPIGLASGYLESPTTKDAKQVIVVVTEGWIVMCFDYNLELLWESTPVDEVPEGYYFEEIAIMIAPHPVRIGDNGIVVVGGRLASNGLEGEDIEHEHETSHIGPDKKIEREEEGQHFTYYAFDGKTGSLRWKHEEGDFFSKDPHQTEEGYDDDVETFMPSHSFKQHVFSQSRHLGEVDWRQYRQNVLAHLPYRWTDGYDSHFALDRFEKKTNSGRKPSATKSSDTWNTDAIGIPNPLGTEDLATNQLSPKRDVEKPNVLVATVRSGLEIVHLFTGRPLCRMILPSLQAPNSAGAYADVNGDGVIDEVLATISDQKNPLKSKTSCLAVVSTGLPVIEQLWNGSICKSSGLDNLAFKGLGLANSRTLTTITPAFIPSSFSLGLNSIFMVSSGRVSAYGPNGESLWNVGSTANWRAVDYPVLTPIHILPKDPSLHILAIGTSLSLISPDGQLVSTVRLRKASELQETADSGIAGGPKHGEIWSVAPPTLGDIDNDGLADVIIVGHDGFYAFTIRRGVGSLLFASLIITLIGVMLFALVQSEGGLGKSGVSSGQRGARIKRALD